MKVDTIINLAVLGAVSVAGVLGYQALSGLLSNPGKTASGAGRTTGGIIKMPWSFGKGLGEVTNPLAGYNRKRRAREDKARAVKEKEWTDAFRNSMSGLAPLNIAAQAAFDSGQWSALQYKEFVSKRQHLSNALDNVYKSKFKGPMGKISYLMKANEGFTIWNGYAKAQNALGADVPTVSATGWSNA